MLRLPRHLLLGLVALSVAALGRMVVDEGRYRSPLPGFTQQFCALEDEWRTRIERGLYPGRNGDVVFLPRTPIYYAAGGNGWNHSGPWDYLQRIPLVFYGPGRIPGGVEAPTPATTADIAPTIAALMKGVITSDGNILNEVARLEGSLFRRAAPRVIVTVVLDGAGWNVLDRWPDAWPTLARLMAEGTSYGNATVGSSPSVTPAIHTTLGTGVFPSTHGITSVPVRDEQGAVVDPFYEGESARLLDIETVGEFWDRQNDNRALVAMIGHVPWHLGMIGQGAERPGADRDHAAWLDLETSEWITNPTNYELPDGFEDQDDLDARLAELDGLDGTDDGLWREVPLDDRSRIEEVPAFAAHHMDKLTAFMSEAGYGRDQITDLVFTNMKQIDLLGHYFNMESIQVRDALRAGDAALGDLIDHLERSVGTGRYVVVITADHGQQPDAGALKSYGINSNELVADVEREFGDVVLEISPTELFLDRSALEEAGDSIEKVAYFVADYRIRDNGTTFGVQTFGAGRFAPGDRVMAMAVPSEVLIDIEC